MSMLCTTVGMSVLHRSDPLESLPTCGQGSEAMDSALQPQPMKAQIHRTRTRPGPTPQPPQARANCGIWPPGTRSPRPGARECKFVGVSEAGIYTITCDQHPDRRSLATVNRHGRVVLSHATSNDLLSVGDVGRCLV